MRPPKNAKATAAFTDIETEDVPSAPACTVMRVSATGVEVPETAAGCNARDFTGRNRKRRLNRPAARLTAVVRDNHTGESLRFLTFHKLFVGGEVKRCASARLFNARGLFEVNDVTLNGIKRDRLIDLSG